MINKLKNLKYALSSLFHIYNNLKLIFIVSKINSLQLL